MTAALLVIVGVLVGAAAALFVVSFRRADAIRGLAGMTVMIAAAIPAAVYANVAS